MLGLETSYENTTDDLMDLAGYDTLEVAYDELKDEITPGRDALSENHCSGTVTFSLPFQKDRREE